MDGIRIVPVFPPQYFPQRERERAKEVLHPKEKTKDFSQLLVEAIQKDQRKAH
ncbi:hypothetical protein GTO89_09980 [Heliobacterium gestii]|uniref:Uncharacterized protein n=1 Tax=Heliomicrobium gestii TaxID=2699 RepID=A0A845LB00_HELGE|nr:hypothetical protein [Heliomicrobium gestii]MBM7868170.1 hypothetical protein [Heliomicrobium gestii]MZP43368.1 hypothetical protein [Heliomicrobium gestii]